MYKRIIPCLDFKDGRVVKGINFKNLKDTGDPIELAKVYSHEGADELIFLDISASYEKRKTTIDTIKKIAQNITIPFIVGGGISNISDIEMFLDAGADKVSIGTAALKNPNLIKEASLKYGKNRIVIGIDAKRKNKTTWEVYVCGGRAGAGINAIDWAKQVEALGAGEILLTSMDNDGKKEGYDIDLVKSISEAVAIPVIASGGAGKLEDFRDVFIKGGANAALAASLFHYGLLRIRDVKEYLSDQGVEVKL